MHNVENGYVSGIHVFSYRFPLVYLVLPVWHFGVQLLAGFRGATRAKTNLPTETYGKKRIPEVTIFNVVHWSMNTVFQQNTHCMMYGCFKAVATGKGN